jgi:hypothetical protein
MDADDRDPWEAEALAFADGQREGDFEVAAAAEMPDELRAFVIQAEVAPNFTTEFDEWLDHLLSADEHTLMLALEQSCHLGVLLPWDLRGVRLATLPAATLAALHRLIDVCPRHVLVHLAHYVYWLLRSERARRRGSPEWSPSLPLAPEPDWAREPPAFKAIRDWPARRP